MLPKQYLCTWCSDLLGTKEHWRSNSTIKTHRRRYYQRRALDEFNTTSDGEELPNREPSDKDVASDVASDVDEAELDDQSK